MPRTLVGPTFWHNPDEERPRDGKNILVSTDLGDVLPDISYGGRLRDHSWSNVVLWAYMPTPPGRDVIDEFLQSAPVVTRGDRQSAQL